MKKILSLILSIISIFALCSCGAEKALSPGETFSDEHLDFTLNNFYSGKNLTFSFTSDDFLIPSEEQTWIHADDERIMISLFFTIKNTGKETIRIAEKWNAEIIYGDGITFSSKIKNHWYTKNNGEWSDLSTFNSFMVMDVEPMAEKEFRLYIDVPEEVISNTEAPLSVKFTCHADKEDTDYFINYKIR